MHITRRKTRQIRVGSVKIGGDAPVSVQSMCSTDTRDVAATVDQIRQLEAVGCEVIRVAVPDVEAANALTKIKAAMTVPLIADIHFDHRLALKAAEVVDCVRINPGNIGAWWKVEEVIKAVNDHGIPIRVGVNGGSLERTLLDKYGWPSPEALAESALNAVHALEEVKVGFEILKSLELRHRGINVIACPTCGRVEIDVVRMANELEKKLGHIKAPLNVSVLGCVVNGIGEGKEADIGIAGGEGKGILFKKGKLVRKVPMEELMDTLIHEVELLAKEKEAEANGESAAPSNDGLEALGPQPAHTSTLGKEIPLLYNRR